MPALVSGRGDIVIVGGGPAGTTAAIALATAAPELRSRLVVLEKQVYPREKYCAGGFGARGEKVLQALGIEADVPSVRIDGMSLRTGEGEAVARVPAVGRVVRRIEFDHRLAEEARRRGVKVMDGTRVDAVQANGRGRVRVETSRGAIDAAVVVGADGVGSVVRKTMGLGGGELRAQVLELDTEPTAADRERHVLRFDARDRGLTGYLWDFPTMVKGAEMWCRGIYHLRLDDGAPDVDIRAKLDAYLAEIGLDITKYKQKRFAERGFEPARRVAQGRMMLAGEAAGIDPITGEGIAQAVEYGAMAGRFVAESLESRRPIEAWNEVVRSSRLYRDLAIRVWCTTRFYGALRPRMERLLVANPDAIHIGMQHFAAERVDRARLASVLTRGAATMLAGALWPASPAQGFQGMRGTRAGSANGPAA